MANRHEEIRYLREKAQQFRKLAATHKTQISAQLIEIAAELEARADALARDA